MSKATTYVLDYGYDDRQNPPKRVPVGHSETIIFDTPSGKIMAFIEGGGLKVVAYRRRALTIRADESESLILGAGKKLPS